MYEEDIRQAHQLEILDKKITFAKHVIWYVGKKNPGTLLILNGSV